MKEKVKQITDAIISGADIRESLNVSEATINNLYHALIGWTKDDPYAWSFIKKDNELEVDGPFIDIPCTVSLSIVGDTVSCTVTAKVDNQDYSITEKGSFDSWEDVQATMEKAYNRVKEQFLASKDEMNSEAHLVENPEEVEELSVEESASLDPLDKDIARAEKLKTQNSRFALKQAMSIEDKPKMIRRMKAVGKICGLDSEQYDAFKYAAKGFLTPDEIAEIEVFVKAA